MFGTPEVRDALVHSDKCCILGLCLYSCDAGALQMGAPGPVCLLSLSHAVAQAMGPEKGSLSLRVVAQPACPPAPNVQTGHLHL